MFSRQFMRHFNANKYRNPMRQIEPGTWHQFPIVRDMSIFRVLFSAAFVSYIWNMYREPGLLHELFWHAHYPGGQVDVSKRGVPKEVLQPNEQALEKWRQLEKVKELLRKYE